MGIEIDKIISIVLGHFDIRKFGAKLDGVTEDTTSIQNAIDAAEAVGNGRIHHPGGTSITGKFTVSISKGLSFTGIGWGSIYKAKSSLNDNMVQFAANAAGIWCHFRDLKFDGNNTNQSGGNIIDAQNAIECRFDHVWFHEPYNWAVNLYGYLSDFGHHNNFTNCLFDEGDNSSGQGGAIKCDNNDENTAMHCEFQYMGGSGSTYNCSILDNSGLNNWSHNTFVDSRSGIYILDASMTRVIGNMFDRIQYDNIYVKGASNIIQNNMIYEIGGSRSGSSVASGVVIDYYGQNDVSHNFFKASPNDGRTRSFIYDIGGAASGYNSFVGNKIKDDSGILGGSAWDINSTPNTRHSNDRDDIHKVMMSDFSEESIIGGGGTSMSWYEVTTGSTTAAVNTGYFANSATEIQFDLPSTFAQGDIVEVFAQNTGLFKVLPASGDSIRHGSLLTVTGLEATTIGSALRLVGVTANSLWGVLNSQGGTFAEPAPSTFYSLQFDGSNDKADIADAADLDGFAAGTIEFYFKSFTGSGAAYQKLMKKNGAFDIGIAQDFGGGAKVFAEINGVANLGDFAGGVADSTWRHLAISWDASTIYAWMDGVLVDSAASAGTQGTGSDPIEVGHSGSSEILGGRISKIRISNTNRYTAGFTPPTTDFVDDANTIALYLLTEGSGNASDASGNAHTLTLDATNPPSWSTDLPY